MEREYVKATTFWFTETFYPIFYAKGGGMGFTLVGQGYLDFGMPGVIGLFVVLGVFIGQLYRLSGKSTIAFIFYINLIPVVMYSIRQTISVILSQSIKHVMLPLIIMFCLGMFWNDVIRKVIVTYRNYMPYKTGDQKKSNR